MASLQSSSTPAHKWLRTNVATATGLRTFNRVLTGIEIPDDFIVVGAVKHLKQEWAGFGNGRRYEHFQIPVYVRVCGASAKPAEADVDSLYDQAWQFANAVVAVITDGLSVNGVAGDHTLGGNVIFSEFQSADENEPVHTNAGRIEVAVTFEIHCQAVLTK